MTTPNNKLTPATIAAAIAAAIAAEAAKPGQVVAQITTVAIHDGQAFANALENLDTSTAGELEALFRAHALSAALAERMPENLAHWENRAKQTWISANAAAVVEAYQGEHDSRLKAATPTRESMIERLATWTRLIRAYKGPARDAEIDKRDAVEAQLDSVEWLFESLQTAIDRFASLPNVENLAGCSSSLGSLDCELTKVAKLAGK